MTPEQMMEEAQRIIAAMPDTDIRTAIIELSKEDPQIWCMVYRRLKGRPLSFDMSRHLTPQALQALQEESPKSFEKKYKMLLRAHRPFLIEPLCDTHPHKVYEKGRQMGVSELSIIEETQFLDANDGTKWIHTFPRDTQLRDFSTTRIAEAFKETPRIRRLLSGQSGIYVKKIRNSFMILRSAWEENLGEGVDADGVTLDEKDRMRDGVEVAFRESLSSSLHGLFREVSTPTLPGRGVDASFQDSDQRAWLVRCVRCGMEQEIEWPDNIVEQIEIEPGQKEIPEGAYEYQCRKTKCRGALDRLGGRWVARKPNVKEIRGYHIPQTIAPWISATELMRKKKAYKFLQLWVNYCLGKTSKGEHILLADSDFEMACSGHQLIYGRTDDWRHISVGVDWGNINWAVVLGENVHNGRPYILNAFQQPDTGRELEGTKLLADKIAPFDPDIIVADNGFGKDRVQHLLRRFGVGRVFGCWYNKAEKGSRTFQPVWGNPEQAKVLADRTMMLKEVCRAIRDLELGIPDRSLMDVKYLEAHLRALAPMYEIDEDDGKSIIETVKSDGDDHLAHCTGYAWLGYDNITSGSHFQYDYIDSAA